MEYFKLPSFPIFLSSLVFCFMMLRIILKQNCNSSTLNLPPGPWKLPLIGNIHLLVGYLPHRRLRDLAAKYGPVMHLQLGEVSQIVISSAEAAKEMMKDNDVCFLQRPHFLLAPIISYGYTDIVFAPYGDYWRQMRKICAVELFSAKRVQSYRSIREEEVLNLVRAITSAPAGSAINYSKKVFSLINNITAKAAFGWKCKDQEAFKELAQKTVELSGGFSLVDLYPSMKFLEVLSGTRSELERLHKELDVIAGIVIQEHRVSRVKRSMADEDEVDDLLHVLLNLEDEGLATDNIKAIILDMFLGGSDMPSVLVEWAMSELIKNPRVLEKAQAEVRKVGDRKGNVDEADLHELQYLNQVIKEAFRVHPPFTMILPREWREACKISGYDIPVGSKVSVNAWAIGRDPKYWTEPDKFYPERFFENSVDYKGNHFELIPFGAGRRMCPGVSFGIASVELLLAQLLYHFNWKLPDGMENEDLDMTEFLGVTVRRKNDLYLVPTPYHSTEV